MIALRERGLINRDFEAQRHTDSIMKSLRNC